MIDMGLVTFLHLKNPEPVQSIAEEASKPTPTKVYTQVETVVEGLEGKRIKAQSITYKPIRVKERIKL